jgi:large subunit ribosomal protein L22
MNARAQAKFIRQSPNKVRRVLDLVRGLPVDEAQAILQFTNRKAATTIKKVLDSAIANAEHNFALDRDELFIAEAYADEGPTLKRWRPRARGRATQIRKRTSHITIVVADDVAVPSGREEGA